ncbi:MAG: hypothetical protein ACO1SV_25745 [Fimbriimonas sp.]
MITTLLAAAMTAQALPPKAIFAFTGLPTFSSNQGEVEVRSHSATITIRDGGAYGTSTTEVRNPSNETATVRVFIPHRGYATSSNAPSITTEATWAGRPLNLKVASPNNAGAPGPLPSLWQTGAIDTVYMPPRSTAALRVNFRSALGTAGLDGKLRVIGYDLGGSRQVGQLNLTLKYDERQVFGLPTIQPAEGWKIGAQGAFFTTREYTPKNERMVATFYTSKFDG